MSSLAQWRTLGELGRPLRLYICVWLPIPEALDRPRLGTVERAPSRNRSSPARVS
jgi:hypothetical protein